MQGVRFRGKSQVQNLGLRVAQGTYDCKLSWLPRVVRILVDVRYRHPDPRIEKARPRKNSGPLWSNDRGPS